MGVTDSVNKGFTIAKSNFSLSFVLILLYLAYFGVNFALNTFSGLPKQPQDASTLPPGELFRQMSVGMAIGLIGLIIQNYIQAGLVGHVGNTIRNGQQPLSVFFTSAKKFALKLFAQALVIMGLILVVFLIAVILMGIIGAASQPAGLIVGLPLMGIAIYLSLLLFYSSYILVLENKGLLESMKLSVGFVRRNLLSLLGLILIFIVLFLIPLVLLGGFVVLIQGPLKGVAAIAVSVVAIPLFIFILAFYGIAVTGAVISFYLGRSSHSAA